MTDAQSILVTSPLAGIVTITLNRPKKRNALNQALIQKMTQALKEIAMDSSTRVLMIMGNGTHFCAGADIDNMQKIALASREENVEDAKQLALLLQMLYTLPKPTIALLHGMTLGGGLGLMACCDIAIATESASFCFSEAKIGLTPSVISPYVISAMGERAARYYFLTAETLNAHESKRMGLTHRIVADDALMQEGLAVAHELLKNSPNALLEAKKLIAHVANKDLSQELIDFTTQHLAGMRATEEAQEGLKAFLEKRIARWSL